MKKDYTHMIIVLDRSGSMHPIRGDAEGGLNAFIEKQRNLEGEATLTVAKFDDQYEIAANRQPIQELGEVRLEPRGSTALLDAVGRSIATEKDAIQALPESERPEKVVFVVVTDGLENASREFNKGQIKEMVEQQSNDDAWEFVFLGANVDAFAEAGGMGIGRASTLAYDSSKVGVMSSYSSLSDAVGRYRSGRSKKIGFTKDERERSK